MTIKGIYKSACPDCFGIEGCTVSLMKIATTDESSEWECPKCHHKFERVVGGGIERLIRIDDESKEEGSGKKRHSKQSKESNQEDVHSRWL